MTIGDLVGIPHDKHGPISIITGYRSSHLRFLSNFIMLHESNNEGKKNPIKSDCVSLMSSIGGEFIQQLGPVE